MVENSHIYTVCDMCTARCPLEVEVRHGEVIWLHGNRHATARGALCPWGAAGVALAEAHTLPAAPLLRTGKRGQGLWKEISWDEGLSRVGDAIRSAVKEYGADAVALSHWGGACAELYAAVLQGVGSVHCYGQSVQTSRLLDQAYRLVTGSGAAEWEYDYARCEHIVLQGRDVLEPQSVAEANHVLDAMKRGCALTVVDCMATSSACKAKRFFMIPPGTEYCFNLAVLHTIIEERLYSAGYADGQAKALHLLERFVQEYTPEFAAAETGLNADEIREFTRVLAKAAPRVIWHPGVLTTPCPNTAGVMRSALLINMLLGAFEAAGGICRVHSPENLSYRPLNPLAAAAKAPFADFASYLDAVDAGEQPPFKVYMAYQDSPLFRLPDESTFQRRLARTDFIVSLTTTWSACAEYADLVLPVAHYLSKAQPLFMQPGATPHIYRPGCAVLPQNDALADWEITAKLSSVLHLPKGTFSSIHEVWNHQLQGSGLSAADFEEKGFVTLHPKKSVVKDPASLLPQGILEAYIKRQPQLRLVLGRVRVHALGHVLNEPLLLSQLPENQAWMHEETADRLRFRHNDQVLVHGGGYSVVTHLSLCSHVHPDVVYLPHGFGECSRKHPEDGSRVFMAGVFDCLEAAAQSLCQTPSVTVEKL